MPTYFTDGTGGMIPWPEPARRAGPGGYIPGAPTFDPYAPQAGPYAGSGVGAGLRAPYGEVLEYQVPGETFGGAITGFDQDWGEPPALQGFRFEALHGVYVPDFLRSAVATTEVGRKLKDEAFLHYSGLARSGLYLQPYRVTSDPMVPAARQWRLRLVQEPEGGAGPGRPHQIVTQDPSQFLFSVSEPSRQEDPELEGKSFNEVTQVIAQRNALRFRERELGLAAPGVYGTARSYAPDELLRSPYASWQEYVRDPTLGGRRAPTTGVDWYQMQAQGGGLMRDPVTGRMPEGYDAAAAKAQRVQTLQERHGWGPQSSSAELRAQKQAAERERREQSASLRRENETFGGGFGMGRLREGSSFSRWTQSVDPAVDPQRSGQRAAQRAARESEALAREAARLQIPPRRKAGQSSEAFDRSVAEHIDLKKQFSPRAPGESDDSLHRRQIAYMQEYDKRRRSGANHAQALLAAKTRAKQGLRSQGFAGAELGLPAAAPPNAKALPQAADADGPGAVPHGGGWISPQPIGPPDPGHDFPPLPPGDRSGFHADRYGAPQAPEPAPVPPPPPLQVPPPPPPQRSDPYRTTGGTYAFMPPLVTVPDLVGSLRGAALEARRRARLRLADWNVPPPDAYVYAQDPAAGTQVPVQSAVLATYGQMVRVPYLINSTPADARSLLGALGLKIREANPQPPQLRPYVQSQEPVAGVIVLLGQIVDVTYGVNLVQRLRRRAT